MTNNDRTKNSPGIDLSLTPDQHGLLLAALSSNRSPAMPSTGATPSTRAANSTEPKVGRANTNPTQGRQSLDANRTSGELQNSSAQVSPLFGGVGSDGFDESPLLDFEPDDEGYWETSAEKLFGNLPGASNDEEGDLHDKRKVPEDDDDDESGHKRREGEDKSVKKAGRKPLTGEPTSVKVSRTHVDSWLMNTRQKRKAQNRAAQRAFRERKERHLKDLETKVDDLEKASESTNHENGRLRAQVDRLNNELKEYKKRLSFQGGLGRSPPLAAVPPSRRSWNPNPNDFQFAFPKFGDLPGSNFIQNGSLARVGSNRVDQPMVRHGLPDVMRASSSGSLSEKSPTNISNSSKVSSPNHNLFQSPSKAFSYEDLFSPSILESASRSNSSDYMGFNNNVGPATNSEKNGTIHRASTTSNVTSPSNSSTSNNGLDSSCGTTPEPSADSPDTRKGSEPTLNTISEETLGQRNTEAPSSVMKSPTNDFHGIDWMAQQNGGQFDPILFGDYRDPQDNILNNNTFGDFFNDAFLPQDFSNPFNTGDFIASPPSKRDLMKEVEIQQLGNDDIFSARPATTVNDTNQTIGCNKLWDRVNGSKKVQAGEVDMDHLCAQLKAKARCNGSTTVIDTKDVDEILGPEPSSKEDFMKMFS
ncbi:DNA-binding transcription factor yap1 [Pseudocyphellaria aurata]|nr:DNA-binding transcription factor yap1 [Pseudocyphellaria aurata]